MSHSYNLRSRNKDVVENEPEVPPAEPNIASSKARARRPAVKVKSRDVRELEGTKISARQARANRRNEIKSKLPSAQTKENARTTAGRHLQENAEPERKVRSTRTKKADGTRRSRKPTAGVNQNSATDETTLKKSPTKHSRVAIDDTEKYSEDYEDFDGVDHYNTDFEKAQVLESDDDDVDYEGEESINQNQSDLIENSRDILDEDSRKELAEFSANVDKLVAAEYDDDEEWHPETTNHRKTSRKREPVERRQKADYQDALPGISNDASNRHLRSKTSRPKSKNNAYRVSFSDHVKEISIEELEELYTEIKQYSDKGGRKSSKLKGSAPEETIDVLETHREKEFEEFASLLSDEEKAKRTSKKEEVIVRDKPRAINDEADLSDSKQFLKEEDEYGETLKNIVTNRPKEKERIASKQKQALKKKENRKAVLIPIDSNQKRKVNKEEDLELLRKEKEDRQDSSISSRRRRGPRSLNYDEVLEKSRAMSEYDQTSNWKRFLNAHKVVRFKGTNAAMTKAVQKECMRELYVKGDGKMGLHTRSHGAEDSLDDTRPDDVTAMLIHPNRIFREKVELLQYAEKLHLKNVTHLKNEIPEIVFKHIPEGQLTALNVPEFGHNAEKLATTLIEHYCDSLREIYISMNHPETAEAVLNCKGLEVLSLLEFDEGCLADVIRNVGSLRKIRFRMPLHASAIQFIVGGTHLFKGIKLDTSLEDSADKIFNAVGTAIESYSTIDDDIIGRGIRKADNLRDVNMIISQARFCTLVDDLFQRNDATGTRFWGLERLRFNLVHAEDDEANQQLFIDGLKLLNERIAHATSIKEFRLACEVPKNFMDEMAEALDDIVFSLPTLQRIHLNFSMIDKKSTKKWLQVLSNIAFGVATSQNMEDVFINQGKDIKPRMPRDTRLQLVERWNGMYGWKASTFVVDRRLISDYIPPC